MSAREAKLKLKVFSVYGTLVACPGRRQVHAFCFGPARGLGDCVIAACGEGKSEPGTRKPTCFLIPATEDELDGAVRFKGDLGDSKASKIYFSVAYTDGLMSRRR